MREQRQANELRPIGVNQIFNAYAGREAALQLQVTNP